MKNPALIINRERIQSGDEIFSNGRLMLNSLPYGTYSAVYRVPLSGDDLSISLQNPDREEMYQAPISLVQRAGIRELFGSTRIRTLEQIQGGFYSDGELQEVLRSLGYNREHASLYEEENTLTGQFLDDLLVTESLRYTIPSSRTAFVCTSIHPGLPVKASVITPTAYPYGWNECCDAYYDYSCMEPDSGRMSPSPPTSPMVLMEDDMDMTFGNQQRMPSPSALYSPPAADAAVHEQDNVSFSILVQPDDTESCLEIELPDWRKIRGLRFIADEDSAEHGEVTVELYLGFRSAPVASVCLSDILEGDIRPLNIFYRKAERVTIVLKFAEKIREEAEFLFELYGAW